MIWPFDNDTTSVEKKLAVRSLFANKKRNVLVGIIVFISGFLLSFMAILLCNATISMKLTSQVDNSVQTIGTVAGIVILLLFTAGFAIKNIVYVSVLQRVQEFAQLRAIGATYRQIINMVKRERQRLVRPYMIAGIIAGFLLNVLLPLDFYTFPSVLCITATSGFIWLIAWSAFRTPAKLAASVSPADALKRQSETTLKKRKKKHKVTPEWLGWQYCCSNKRKMAYTFSSLLLSGILMFLVFSVLNAIDVERLASQPYKEGSDLYIRLNSTADEDSTYNLMKNSPFTNEAKEYISHLAGVEHLYEGKMLDCRIYTDDTPDSEAELGIESILSPDSFEKEIVEGNLPHKNSENGVLPVVVNRKSPYYQELGKELHVGDTLSGVVDTGASDLPVIFSVSGFVEDRNTGVVLYTNGEILDQISEMNCTLTWYICLTDGSIAADTVHEIKEKVQQDDRIYVSVLTDDISSLQEYFHNARVIVIVLTALVSLFSFINLLNTSITNAITRKHDYALLEATGMTKRQISKAQRTENLIYLIGSFIGSCILGIPMGFVLCSRISQIPGLSYFEYHFPVLFLLLYFVAVLLVYSIVHAYQNKLFFSQSVVERIKTAE